MTMNDLTFNERAMVCGLLLKERDEERKKVIDKACEWLEKNAWKYDYANRYRDEDLVDDFRKAMET